MSCVRSGALVALALALLSVNVSGCSQENFLERPAVIMTDPKYDGSKVDWKGFMDAIDCVGQREHTFCTFVTRMFFHDIGAVAETPKVSGSDGSLLINPTEGISPPNVQHGEAPMVRYVLKNFVNKYGMSWSDGLTVAAAVCSNSLGSPVSIPKVCHNAGVPFLVGKLDSRGLSQGEYFAQQIADLPGPDATLKTFITFWRDNLNSYVKEEKWKLNFKDVSALMGSHALLFTHGCTANKQGLRSAFLDNSYFKDVLSGEVNVYRKGDKCGNNSLKRPCMPAATGESAGCEFDEPGFAQKTGVALAQVVEAQKDIFAFPPSKNPPFVNWLPDDSRAPCIGRQCKKCQGFQTMPTSVRPYCIGRQPGESFWPYTVNDGFLAKAAKMPTKGNPDQRAISEAYNLFKMNLAAFRKFYAIGSCKLNAVAANYGKGPTDLYDKVGGYIGKCSNAKQSDKLLIEAIFKPPTCSLPGQVQAAKDGGEFEATEA